MKPKLLFIGGIADGQRLEDPVYQQWQVQESIPLSPTTSHVTSRPIRHTYVRTSIYGNTIYRLESIPAPDVVSILIKSYKKP